jgi:hypothetical protein
VVRIPAACFPLNAACYLLQAFGRIAWRESEKQLIVAITPQ